MNKLLLSLILTFVAYVKTPLGQDRRYIVESFKLIYDGHGQVYELTLLDGGKKVYAPVLFTVIEER